MKLEFADKHKYDTSGYTCTNEDPGVFISLLTKHKVPRFRRVGAIASGGEMPLLMLLPHADSVICVDHSYRALAVCALKAIALSELGRDIKKLLAHPADNYSNYWKMFDAIVPQLKYLPEWLQAKVKMLKDGNDIYGKPDKYGSCNTFSYYDWQGMQREWTLIGDDRLDEAAKRVNCVSFIHGDLLHDLKAFGPFDGLYVSNALEHTNREAKQLTGEQIAPMLDIRGYLLSTNTPGKTPPPTWKELEGAHSKRTGWTHRLIMRMV